MGRYPPLVTAFVLLGVVFTVHALSPVDTVYDSRWSLPTAMSLIRHGDLDLDEYPDARPGSDWRVEEVGGRRYNRYPLGPSLVAVPTVLLATGVARLAGLDLEAVLKRRIVARLEVVVAAFLVALNALLLWALARRELPDGAALLVALVFAFATPAWSSASRALWQHAPAMLCVTLAVAALWGPEPPPWRAGLAGLAAGGAYLMRPTSALAVLVLGVAAGAGRPRKALWYLFGVAVALGPWVALNLHLYGSPLPSYYRTAQGFEFSPLAVVGTLFSPSRGLFVFSPVLLFALWGVALRRREGPRRTLDAALVALLLLHWGLVSSWACWYGGASLGPRLMCDVAPLLCLFLIPVAKVLGEPRRRGLRVTFGLLLAWSVLANGDCAANWGTADWNHEPCEITDCPQRVWDLHDLQLLRLRRGR